METHLQSAIRIFNPSRLGSRSTLNTATSVAVIVVCSSLCFSDYRSCDCDALDNTEATVVHDSACHQHKCEFLKDSGDAVLVMECALDYIAMKRSQEEQEAFEVEPLTRSDSVDKLKEWASAQSLPWPPDKMLVNDKGSIQKTISTPSVNAARIMVDFIPPLTPAVLEAFIKANAYTHSIKATLRAGSEKQKPAAVASIALSYPAVDLKGKIALVFVDVVRGGLSGGRQFVVLEKKSSDKWTVTSTFANSSY